MNIEAWTELWRWVLIVSAGLYLGVGLLVSVWGFFGVKELFRRLEAAGAADSRESSAHRESTRNVTIEDSE